MSSFKKKVADKPEYAAPGTRTVSGAHQTILVSTGMPSLDDLLGGGIPLSTLLVVEAPDPHSDYADLISKYSLVEGIAHGHRVCIVGNDPESLVRECMWTPSSSVTNDPGGDGANKDGEIKIAWRYQKMKQFQTSVSNSKSASEDDYCHNFDLTSRMPAEVVDECIENGSLLVLPLKGPQRDSDESLPDSVLRRIEEFISQSSNTGEDSARTALIPVRIFLPDFASPLWGDLLDHETVSVVFSLRRLLRNHPHASGLLTLSPHLSAPSTSAPNLIEKIRWIADSFITLTAFSADPSLAETFPLYHGFAHLHAFPSPHTLLPPSDKTSTLRFGDGIGRAGENNLAFKCTRRRLLFETLHLDVEGGVGERRTTPATGAMALQEQSQAGTEGTEREAAAVVSVELEELKMPSESEPEKKPKRVKKKVAFHSERPDLYDF